MMVNIIETDREKGDRMELAVFYALQGPYGWRGSISAET